MADLTNENQDGENSGGDDSFGEVATREETATQDGGSESTANAGEEETGDSTEETGETGKTEEAKTEEGKPELTEKGTKVDPNPQSAVHQELANAKRAKANMEAVLANPKKLAEFMETEYGIKASLPAKEEEAPIKEFKAEDFETLDDVAVVVNGLQKGFAEKSKTYESEIQQLKTAVQSLQQGGRASQLATTMSSDIDSLRGQPELDPKSPDFIEGLEEDIGSMYYKLDFDEEKGSFRGNYSIADIGNRIIAAARRGGKNGSLKTQTVVKNKSEGKVVTSPKVKSEGGEDSLTPEDSIAAGISKMFKN